MTGRASKHRWEAHFPIQTAERTQMIQWLTGPNRIRKTCAVEETQQGFMIVSSEKDEVFHVAEFVRIWPNSDEFGYATKSPASRLRPSDQMPRGLPRGFLLEQAHLKVDRVVAPQACKPPRGGPQVSLRQQKPSRGASRFLDNRHSQACSPCS